MVNAAVYIREKQNSPSLVSSAVVSAGGQVEQLKALIDPA